MFNSRAIVATLEETAPNRDGKLVSPRATANKADILNWRDTVMKFMSELDGDLTVEEVCATLADYA